MRKSANHFPARPAGRLACARRGACTADVKRPRRLRRRQAEEDKAAAGRGPPERQLPIGEIRVIDSQDRPEARRRPRAETPKVLALVNSYYNTAFLDPASGPTAPIRASPTTSPRRPRARSAPDRGAGAGRRGQEPGERQARQPADRPAQPTISTGLERPVRHRHHHLRRHRHSQGRRAPRRSRSHTRGTFWLQKEGDDFHINAFNADIDMKSQ